MNDCDDAGEPNDRNHPNGRNERLTDSTIYSLDVRSRLNDYWKDGQKERLIRG